MLALERVARLGNVTRAAEELNTSQSAISRHLRQLEADLGVTIVAPSGRGIALTAAGQAYAREVSEALVKLREAGARARADAFELTIACTHEVSHLILMPRYADLKKALGRDAHIRISTCEYPAIPAMIDAGADIIFEYRLSRPGQHSTAIAAEEIVPVAAPGFLENNRARLEKTPDAWRGITRLALTKANSGWATWEDWFKAQGVDVPIDLPRAPQPMFDNYVYALEAATRGDGLVLAWRGFADRYLNSGQLVPVRPDWLVCGPTLYAVATANGRAKGLVRTCLKALSRPARTV